MTFRELEALIKSTYLIADPGVIRLLCLLVITHRLPIDPVWLFFTAPSSGGKSELLNALNLVDKVFPVDTLTPQTFASGFRASNTGEPSSLLIQIGSGIMAIKDFTTLMQIRRENLEEVTGQLRKIYDGEFTKVFGNGMKVEWKGKITLIAGVTSAIQTRGHLSAAMGERFIIYSILQPPRLEVVKKAMDNVQSTTYNAQRKQIQEAMKEYLDKEIHIPLALPELPEDFQQEIRELSDIATLARSAVERNWMSREREITFVHYPEMPMRFASQLTGLALASKVAGGQNMEEIDKHIIYKIALDSIPAQRRVCLQKLTQYSSVKTSAFATDIGYPTNTVRLWLEDLVALKLIERHKSTEANNSTDEWWMKDKTRAFFSRFENIPMLQIEMPEAEEKTNLELTAEQVFDIPT